MSAYSSSSSSSSRGGVFGVGVRRPPMLACRNGRVHISFQHSSFSSSPRRFHPAFTRTMRFCSVTADESPVVLSTSLIKREPDQALQAVERSDNAGGQEDGSDEDAESITNDALRASILRSKELLAMQRNLLQQIAERKKLVAVLKDSAIHNEQDPLTDQHDSSPSRLETVSESEELGHSTEVPLDSSAQLSDRGAYSSSPGSAHGKSLGEHKEHLESSEDGRSDANVIESFREANCEPSHSKSLPPAVAKLSEPNAASDSKHDGSAEAQSSPLAGANIMNVILVAAECAPWCKTGGLGDVAGALPKALAKRGHRVMVVVPRYGNYVKPQEIGERRMYKVAGQDMEIKYFHIYVDGVDFVFLDSPIFRHVENGIYGGDRMDILKRMALLCKAAVEVPWHVPCGGVCYGDGNLVFIANDWHTALLPVYLKAYYRDNGSMIYARSILVIHNIAHQGRGPVDDFFCLDLPGPYMDLFKLYDPIGGDHLNIFAAGIKASDRLVTVSHGYAWEVKTPEGGWGLHAIIKEHDWKFQGIVNGIDIKDWNPKYDVHLKSDGYTNYSLETLQVGKAQCKAALQRELGLPVHGDVPIIAFIGRLDHQKGVDLIAEAMPWIARQDVQVIMLGSGRQDLEDTLRRLESQHYDSVRGWVGFSVELAHRMTAGADILLMPSRFEPCGLNQLYAMMYGTVPVVHAVGGLRDTVHQFNPFGETGLGWTFEKAEANRMIDALGHCLNTFRNYKSSWEGLQRRGMMQDLSWDNAAKLYEEVLVAAKYQW